MSRPRLRPVGPGVWRAGWTLAGLGLLLAGLAGTAPATRADEVIARLGPITVTAGGPTTAALWTAASSPASRTRGSPAAIRSPSS